MQDLIRIITQALVDEPEKVVVEKIEGHQTSVLELRVAQQDVGKVIGKQGRTVQSLRTILRAVSAKEKKRTVLEIIETPRREVKPLPSYGSDSHLQSK